MLEGTWTLASLEAVDAAGTHRPVKASGQLQYHAYGNMAVSSVVEDEMVKGRVVLDYKGKIIIDPVPSGSIPQTLYPTSPFHQGSYHPVPSTRSDRTSCRRAPSLSRTPTTWGR